MAGPIRVLLILSVMILWLADQPAWAQLAHEHATGTTSKLARQRVQSLIPYHELAPDVARKIADVVGNTSIYRQLPITSVVSDADLYLYLVRYPEVVISTWRLMGVTQMDAQRVAPFQLRTSDGVGTTSDVQLVYGKPNLNIYYAQGEYDGPTIFRKVNGKCVLVLESDYRRNTAGEVVVTSCLNVFLKIDNLAASIIAKTVHPVVGNTADHNFVETLRFVEKLSNTTRSNGVGVQRMANRLPGLRPEVRQQFVEVAGLVYQRELQKQKSINQSFYRRGHPATLNYHPVNPTSYRGN